MSLTASNKQTSSQKLVRAGMRI